ncbi:MAG: hypothetical protein H6627_07475 [Calditrichae bacterium]|nr:hypothetical protein [Calditrichota bacterium]MCB9058390.1 hypothetical protein [Calditrichia bacterium]
MHKSKYTGLFFITCLVIIFTACSDEKKDNVTDTDLNINSCEGCHTNYDVLRDIASPDTVVESGGCGGDAPHIEPYDRVFLGGDGYTEFKTTTHGEMECTECHNGVGNTDDKAEAHSGDFIKHPSDYAEQKCATCHSEVVDKAHNSLHEQGWGQKKRVAMRYGVDSFDDLPEMLKTGYDKNCAKCHGGCGDCHVNRPSAGGGGLYKGHNFVKPNMYDNCVACHVSRGGHAFFGVGSGTVPDVHQSELDYDCLSCHSANEVHGDGELYDRRYDMALKPECSDCHQNLTLMNTYHMVHINTFNCQTCHSQNYNNCGSCHVGGEGARVHSHQNYKIGLNPLSDIKPYKYATLRLTPHAPDSWELYGTAALANFDVEPTYKYTTPHNILRWTTRTQVGEGKECYDNCHIILEGDTYRNRNLYLFSSDMLEDWEISANQSVIVDGKLPASWGTP